MPEMTARKAHEYRLGPVDNIPVGEGRTVIVAGERIAVFRSRSGTVHAVQAACPHKGGPLADGVVAGDSVACPLHEFSFRLNDGAPVGNQCERLKTYEARLNQDGQVVISLP